MMKHFVNIKEMNKIQDKSPGMVKKWELKRWKDIQIMNCSSLKIKH